MAFVKKAVPAGEENELQNYLSRLTGYATVTDKMIQLSEISRLTFEDINKRNAIRHSIYMSLSPYYPQCEVFIYGSTNNGFGVKGSDLDMLFMPSLEYCKTGAEAEIEEEVEPTLGQVHFGQVPIELLQRLGETAQLRFVRRVLRKNRSLTRIILIPAKCPILNFLGTGSHPQLSCDLSSRNRLVVWNTELMRFFESMDPRVRPLVVTLRFWAKALGLIHTSTLSSYAFTLLVIFFLQNADPPVLPPVNLLMDLSDSSCIIAGWEVSFTQDLGKVPKTVNRNSEGKLLQKFFSFFLNFDFMRNVICVRTGKALSIEELKNLDFKGFEISAMCIQDPFDLSHNVGKNVKDIGLPYFKPALLIAGDLISGNPDCGQSCNRDGFTSLFDAPAFKKETEEKFYFQQDPPFFLVNLNRDIVSVLGDGSELLRKWYSKATEAVYELLLHGLLMDCEVIDKAGFVLCSGGKNDKVEVGRDKNCLLTIQCAVYDRVWTNRKAAPLPEHFDSDTEEFTNVVLRTEHTISKNIIRTNPHLSCQKPIFWFLCTCYKTNYPQLQCLVITLSPLTRSKEFKQAHKFLSSYLPRNVTRVLLEANSDN